MSLMVITSPAKKMRVSDELPWPATVPAHLERTRELMRAVQGLSLQEAQALWACSDRLAQLNYDRFAQMDLERDLTAAVTAYEGIQYQHMAPQVMTQEQLDWLQGHLRILSGFYGMLRPLDGVVPYRLEMQARLAVGGARDLYGFWGPALYEDLAAAGCTTIVNVASVEYSRAVTPHVREDGPQVLTCLFGTIGANGRLKQASTEAKAARGTFIRWCAENNVTQTQDLLAFDQREYRLDQERSSKDTLVFVRP